MFQDGLGIGNFTHLNPAEDLEYPDPDVGGVDTNATQLVEHDNNNNPVEAEDKGGFKLVFSRRCPPNGEPLHTGAETDITASDLTRCFKGMETLEVCPTRNDVPDQFQQSPDMDMDLSWSSTSWSSAPISESYAFDEGLKNCDSEDEPGMPLSQFCDFSHFRFDHQHGRLLSSHEKGKLKLYDYSETISSTSSIVYDSSISSEDLSENWFVEDIPLNRRTKRAPKHRREIYRVVPSRIGSNSHSIREGIKNRRLITRQFSVEKQETVQTSLFKLVIDACKDKIREKPVIKFKASGIATLLRTADEYLKGLIDDFRA